MRVSPAGVRSIKTQFTHSLYKFHYSRWGRMIRSHSVFGFNILFDAIIFLLTFINDLSINDLKVLCDCFEKFVFLNFDHLRY